MTEISAIAVVALADKSKSKVDKRKLVQSKMKFLKENGGSEAAIHPAHDDDFAAQMIFTRRQMQLK